MLAAAEWVHAVETAADTLPAALAAWDAARTRWTDPHDQLAQTIRRTTDELDLEHTSALPGGDWITLRSATSSACAPTTTA